MAFAFEKLGKILSLEQEQGYRNRAVIGGLERLLPLWQKEAREESSDPQHLQLVEEVVSLLTGYGEKDPQGRERAIKEIMSRLAKREVSPKVMREGISERDVELRHKTERLLAKGEPQPVVAGIDLDSPVTKLRGISTVYAKRLERLGVRTIRDLLYLIPRRHDDFSKLKTINQLEYGEEVTIVGTVWETENRETRKGMTITTSIIADGTATIKATWFNQPYLVQRLKPGRQIVISGKVDQYLGHLTFQSPEWEPLEEELIHTGRLVPVYPLTKGLSARWLRRLTKATVDHWSKRLTDHLPSDLRERLDLIDLQTSISQIHFPGSWEMWERARRRLSFDEFLLIQLGVLRQRRDWQELPGRAMAVDEELLRSFIASLPFALTDAQRRALQEITEDMERPRPMNRLLQGDVGSGKTVVAAAAMLMAVANGLQAVMMAPTEILAEQHYKTITELLEGISEAMKRDLRELKKLRPSDPSVPSLRLLTGSLSNKEKEEIHRQIAAGEVDIMVGTHALIQEGVEFKALGLAVIDEQHRFGVRQRAILRQKGYNPHVLVMSATPIPRTLALTIYGDLDISIIDEMPPGRQEIKTRWLMPRERERAYSFLRSQIAKERQAFIICPLIEESEKVETKAAVVEYERLQKEVFPDLKLGLLHGRMKAKDKEEIMGRFYRGELDILVSTPVVEVGIDVPNATVMLVEGADRFGLAQLHQFRGRVGRGEHQSYCLLLADSPGIGGEERLKIIEGTQDGFLLAEEDLKMRGPGEFFGTRQSGLPDLKVAKLSDVRILEQARAAAIEIFKRDPYLQTPEHRLMAQRVDELWRGEGDLS